MSEYDARLPADGEASTVSRKHQDTAELLGLLDDSDEATRYAAAIVLQGRGETDVLDRALELVCGDRAESRDTAAFLLGQLGYRNGCPYRDRSVPALERLLADDPSPMVRATAATALGHLVAACALEVLTRAAADADSRVRLSVAAALGRIGEPESIPVLHMLSDDPDEEVVESARVGMEMLVGRQFAAKPLAELLGIVEDADSEPLRRRVAAEMLAQRDGGGARDHGFRMSMEKDEAMRCGAAYLLAGAASWHRGLRDEIVPFLVDILRHDRSGAVRNAAAEGLAQLGETVVRVALARATTDSDSVTRACASWALVRISARDSRSVPLLDRLLGRNRRAAHPAGPHARPASSHG